MPVAGKSFGFLLFMPRSWYFTRNTNVSGERKMMIFQKFPTFCMKIRISIANAKYLARFSQLFAFFGPARPGCARPYKTNAIPSLFRGSWRPGAHFRKKAHFRKIITKVGKSDFLADFSFFDANHDSRAKNGNQQEVLNSNLLYFIGNVYFCGKWAPVHQKNLKRNGIALVL